MADSASSYTISAAEEEDCDRVCELIILAGIGNRRQHGRVRGETNWPLHLSNRNLFIETATPHLVGRAKKGKS